MLPTPEIVRITADNIADHPQTICFINPKQASFPEKVKWLKQRFTEGLVIKLLYLQGEKRSVGFIEYVPGKYCWRAVEAPDYMFIHCLFTNGKKYQHQGLGHLLLQEVEKDAAEMTGIAVVTSDKSFMANKDIFLKDHYNVVDESGKEQLLAKKELMHA